MVLRLYKCYGEDCVNQNKKHPLDNLIEEGGKRYCKSCLEKRHKEQKDRRELYDTIKEYYNISFPTGMMLKQIKQYQDEAGYTLTGMTKTLKYLKNNCTGITFKPQMGLGIISYKYDEAKEFWINQQRIADAQRKLQENKESLNEVVVVNTKQLDKTNVYKQSRMIDLSNLI